MVLLPAPVEHLPLAFVRLLDLMLLLEIMRCRCRHFISASFLSLLLPTQCIFVPIFRGHSIPVVFIHLSYRLHSILKRLQLLLILIAVAVDDGTSRLLIEKVFLGELV